MPTYTFPTNIAVGDIGQVTWANTVSAALNELGPLVDTKANDNAVVKLTGNQTVAGTKTFSSAPSVPDNSFTIAKTSGLQAALDANIAISKVTGLQTALDGKITAFADPNADRIVFWDDSANAFAGLTASTGLTLSGTTLTVRTGTASLTGILQLATPAEVVTGTDTAKAVTPAGVKAATDAVALTEQPVVTGLTWTGAVNLSTQADASRLLQATLTGNVTLTLPTPSSARAYTVTLVLKQDTTGSRTLTIPAALSSYGIDVVLSTAPSATDIVHLLWTGTNWVVLMGAAQIS